jgi:selenocysteine lyase/cysteine desulfurase
LLAPSEYEGGRTKGYLDTATYGLPPRKTLEAGRRALEGWEAWQDWHDWEADGEACRRLFGGLVGARLESVALVSAVSVAAGLVAASLPAGSGDNVVLYEREFRSNLFPWLQLERRGVELRLRPLDELAASVDERTALVAVSAVQSSDGAVADLDALRRAGTRLFVDATQAAGGWTVPLEGVDYLAAAAYKWLLCPRGLAFLAVAPERMGELQPLFAGWKSSRDPYGGSYGPPLDLADDARRFDVSLPWHVAAAGRASLELLAALGQERIAAHDLGLARRFAAHLGLPEPCSPIVSVQVEDAGRTLGDLDRAGVRCSRRAGGLRFSFHLYNDEADVERAVDVLASAAAWF